MHEAHETYGKVTQPAAHAALIFDLTTPSDDERPVKLVGNFNHWHSETGALKMEKTAPGKYRLKISAPKSLPDPFEYRYLKGGWDDCEVDEYGTLSYPRTIENPASKTVIQDKVHQWMKKGLTYNPDHLPKIAVLSEKFDIPEAIRTRRIAALLPHDYHQTNKRYPVLYLQDGQNLFDDYAPFGNWGVDKKLAALTKRGTNGVIIIAIDHAKEQRIAEFTPSHHTKLGVGDGKNYARFLADSLKPFVDANFRTLPGREHTGIGGSSMGGLVSLYAGMLYPEVYGKLMIFSPSLWVDPEIIAKTSSFHDGSALKVYIYAGGKEGGSLVAHAQNMRLAFEHKKITGWKVDVHSSFKPMGRHNENDWGIEFPKAIEWLFFNKTK